MEFPLQPSNFAVGSDPAAFINGGGAGAGGIDCRRDRNLGDYGVHPAGYAQHAHERTMTATNGQGTLYAILGAHTL